MGLSPGGFRSNSSIRGNSSSINNNNSNNNYTTTTHSRSPPCQDDPPHLPPHRRLRERRPPQHLHGRLDVVVPVRLGESLRPSQAGFPFPSPFPSPFPPQSGERACSALVVDPPRPLPSPCEDCRGRGWATPGDSNTSSSRPRAWREYRRSDGHTGNGGGARGRACRRCCHSRCGRSSSCLCPPDPSLARIVSRALGTGGLASWPGGGGGTVGVRFPPVRAGRKGGRSQIPDVAVLSPT